MSMVEKVRAVEIAAAKAFINKSGCVYFVGLSEAIAAALDEAEMLDARFEQAREAWKWSGSAGYKENVVIIERYFGGEE